MKQEEIETTMEATVPPILRFLYGISIGIARVSGRCYPP